MSFKPLRIGVLGAANIARAFTAGCKQSELVSVEAVASRGLDKAKAFAAEIGIPRAVGSYEALLADADIEAIYIPLPNSMHAEWAIKAVEAGKHVLCEKPIALTAAEARAMYAAADKAGVYLREGFPYLAQPQTRQMRAWLAEAAIGKLTMIRASFGVFFNDPANIRLIPNLGGGALYDAGSYSVSFARIAAGRCPKRVQAAWVLDANGVDRSTVATLDFGNGLFAQTAASFTGAYHRHAMISGEGGVIESNFLNHPPAGGPAVLQIRRGVPMSVPFEPVAVPDGNGFRLEADSFAALVREGEAGWNGATPQESTEIAAILDAIRAAAASGQWVEVGG